MIRAYIAQDVAQEGDVITPSGFVVPFRMWCQHCGGDLTKWHKPHNDGCKLFVTTPPATEWRERTAVGFDGTYEGQLTTFDMTDRKGKGPPNSGGGLDA